MDGARILSNLHEQLQEPPIAGFATTLLEMHYLRGSNQQGRLRYRLMRQPIQFVSTVK